jgi:hypothetical protein
LVSGNVEGFAEVLGVLFQLLENLFRANGRGVVAAFES